MAKNLVIVESPTKAKVIKSFLWPEYTVLSSNWHIRDLAAKKADLTPTQAKLPYATLWVDIDNDFEMLYVTTPAKKKIVKKLKDAMEKDTIIYLASDEDREWEAIAWHLLEVLDKKREHKNIRVVFHEITKKAITEAFKNTRELDTDLVEAQQARRVLDRVVWYKLSPLLWKKIRFWLSAWRVQSACVKIIVDRERQILAFNPEEYWSLTSFVTPESWTKWPHTFDWKLSKKDWKKFVPVNEKEATEAFDEVNKWDFTVWEIVKKEVKRNPPVPFTTSTLQQESSRKLWYWVKVTMMLAQKLYEGKAVEKWKLTGLITYMRTDSVNLSDTALKQAKKVLEKLYWKEYALETPRKFKWKQKWAQEAHEAIRPTDLSLTPEKLKHCLEPDELRLYELIWKRTLATQSTQAILDTVAVDLLNWKYTFRANWQTVKFPWFLKVYTEWTDNPEEAVNEKDKLLPPLKEWEKLNLEELVKKQHFTKWPARFTEASLIKKMEEEWIWRPSTYAPTINTIQVRGYIEKEWKQLAPTDTAFVVTDFLTWHFTDLVDVKFTSKMEEDLDEISEWKVKWIPWLKKFRKWFEKLIWEKDKSVWKEEAIQARELWTDPKSWKPVTARYWKFWAMLMIWTKDDEEKPKFASIPKNLKMETITMEEAMELFKLPRVLWKIKDEEVEANNWPYWPYLKYDWKFISLKDPEDDPFKIELSRASVLIDEYIIQQKEKYIKTFEANKKAKRAEIEILKWPYWPYIKQGKKNFKIPKDRIEKWKLDKMTLKEVKEIMENQPKGRFGKRK